MKEIFVFFFSGFFLTLGSCLAQQAGKNEVSLVWEGGSGLRAEYFNGSNFQKKVLTRIDKDINFSYLLGSPAPGVNTENYSIRWTGSLYAPVTGTYKIIVRVDDGVRLWLNDVKLIDKWKLQETSVYYNNIDLEAGEYYRLKIEYFNEPLHATMQLMWETPEEETSSFFGLVEKTSREIIPTKYLYGELPDKEAEEKQPVVYSEEPVPSVASKKTENPLPDIAEKKVGEKAPKTSLAPATEEIPAAEEIFENLEAGAVVTFKNVLFEQGKYILLEGSHVELDKLVRTMMKYPELRIRIEGHTDKVGNQDLNQSLSFFRAKVIETYLLENGIDRSRMEVKGYGSSRPLADNATEEGRAKNRRVEFVVK